MMRKLLSAEPIWHKGIAFIRMLTGIMMIRHGIEIFDSPKMNEYVKWLTDLHFPVPVFLAYLGKGTELLGGIFLFLGLFTRIAIIPLILTMLVITFGIGQGRILMEDQHPFLFVVLFIFLFITGPGSFSMDNRLQKK